DLYYVFFNNDALSPLSGIASVAVLFFGLVTGLHLDAKIIHERGPALMTVAMASVAVPTILGGVVGLWIAARYPGEVGADIGRNWFAAAVGVCIGVTALPVLGAILLEMNLMGLRIGRLALSIAGFNDAALWIYLGVLLTAVAGQRAKG